MDHFKIQYFTSISILPPKGSVSKAAKSMVETFFILRYALFYRRDCTVLKIQVEAWENRK